MNQFKFSLGSVLRDRTTGFVGTVTVRTEYSDLTKAYGLEQPVKADGTLADIKWIGEHRLEPA